MNRFWYSFGIAVVLFTGLYFLNTQFDLFGRDSRPVHMDEIQETSATGILKTLGTFSVPDAGTHFLEKNDKTTLLLNGLGINLDQYVGKKVEVHGRMTKTPSGKELMQVLSVDVPPENTSSSDTSSSDPTNTSWISFQKSSLGVRFERRANWEVSSSNGLVEMTLPPLPVPPCTTDPCVTPKDDFIRVEQMKNEKKYSLEFFLASKSILPAKSKVGKDALPALKYEYTDSGLIEIYMMRDAFVYKISYHPSEKRSGDSHQNDFFQLVSTFQFVPFE